MRSFLFLPGLTVSFTPCLFECMKFYETAFLRPSNFCSKSSFLVSVSALNLRLVTTSYCSSSSVDSNGMGSLIAFLLNGGFKLRIERASAYELG